MKDVLFVEDDPSTAATMKLLLEKNGYTVTIAANGLEAMQRLEKRLYHTVITDWEMPGMSGAELCKAIRRSSSTGYIYTILLTCREGRENLIQGLKCGADEYLTKPVDEAELLARLQTGHRITHLEHSLRTSRNDVMRLAVRDTVTGAYNRRHLLAQLDNELERSRREGVPVSLLLCEIDHLDQITERQGTEMGTAVLVKTAEVIRNTIRSKIDWVARYNSEQFAVVLPNTPLKAAAEAAERIRARMERTLVEGNNYSTSVTLSIGVVSDQRIYPAEALEPELLLLCANECLYESTNKGGNQTTQRAGAGSDQPLGLDLNLGPPARRRRSWVQSAAG